MSKLISKKNIVPAEKVPVENNISVENTEPTSYGDLRSIMDYTRDFSMFYSGVEYNVYLEGCLAMKVKNFLISYHYVQNKHIDFVKKFGDEDISLFIDSGAFTYTNDPTYQSKEESFWVKHIESYLKWAEKNKKYIFAIASLDLEGLVSSEKVDEWNKTYFEPFMLRTGIPVCFAWHPESSRTWEYYCQRYPYVGFSITDTSVSADNSKEFRDNLNVAEKYGALVHGFGITKTSILPQLPFYTVDSTSWKAGFKYGQVAVWTGRKVQVWQRKDFNEKIFPVLDAYREIKIDKDLINKYYEPEVLRANVYAYMRAEEYIAERLQPLEYWKRQKIQKTDLDDLTEDFFPTEEELLDANDSLKEYCPKMNINPEYEDAVNVLIDACIFVNWDSGKYNNLQAWYCEEEQESFINEMHDTYINRVVSSKEEKISDLIQFFKDCISGKNDKLLNLGTNFDRIIRERDNYVTEDTEEILYLSPEEVHRKIVNLLPAQGEGEGYSEDVALDEEIFRKADIVPVFDEKGKFLKGQQTVRKPKKVYSEKYPKFACDTCYAASKCAEYKAGHVCAYSKLFNRFESRNVAEVIQSLQGIVEHGMTRLQRAMVLEVLNGNVDPVVTGLMQQQVNYLSLLQKMYETGSAEVMKQTKIIKADGSREETTEITNPQSGGVLERLFGNMGNSKESVEEHEPPTQDTTSKSNLYQDLED